MKRDAAIMREGGPTIFASVRHGDGVAEIKEAILGAWRASGAVGKGKTLSEVNGKGKERAD
jgi:urease accessory protein